MTIATLSTLAILLILVVLYLISSMEDYLRGLMYYNLNSIHYMADNLLVQLVLANPGMKYNTDLATDATFAYLRMENATVPTDKMHTEASQVNSVEEYVALCEQDPIPAYDEWTTTYISSSTSKDGWVRAFTIAAAIIQFIACFLSYRRGSL